MKIMEKIITSQYVECLFYTELSDAYDDIKIYGAPTA